jgi:hypothetical protein
MMCRTKRGSQRLTLLAALTIASVAIAVHPAGAQIAAALGKPLASPDLPVGTISVRIVAGDAASPIEGTEVTLMVNGAPRAARTDSAGRAIFAGLPVGAKVVAKVTDADKVEHVSDELAVPDSGGTRVMIATKPWRAGAGTTEAPFAGGGGGGGGMPNPRQLSGQGRPEQADTAGTLTVRVAYDDFQDTPEGQPVMLVGYAADDRVTHQVVATDKAGRAVFSGLDRSGGTSYFAMTLMPRNGAIDRVMSLPVLLESQAGVRMVLSSETRASTAPPIDDLGKADPQVATPAGKLRVVLEGIADLTAKVTVVDAATQQVLAEAKPEVTGPDPTKVQGGAQFQVEAGLPAGTLHVEVSGGPGQAEAPLGDVEIRVIPADSKDATGGLASKTAADGTLRMALQVSGPQKAVFTINGRQLVSQPFELTKSGGKLIIRAHWEDTGRPQALLDVAARPGQVVYAECLLRGQRYRSLPLPLLAAVGSKVTVYVYPRTMLRFQLQAFAEDQLLAAQGKYEITNYSWAPYRAGPDGLMLPLPRGFKGGVVFEPDQDEVSVVPGEGFRIVRPIPPGGRQFHGGFSLAVEDGKVEWSLDLPIGAFQSELNIRQTPGMTVQTPPEVNKSVQTVRQGTYVVLGPITITPKHSMVLSIGGLPSSSTWSTWVPRVVGMVVVLVMLLGVAFALHRPAKLVTAATAMAARKKQLLDELVELERTGANPKRRDQLLVELEGLWS